MYIFRNKASKYYISYDVYPDETYPDFCHGGMSAMSFDILSDIYRTAETTNFDGFYLEDVLITGILRQKTYNTSDQITAIDYNNVLFHNGRPEVLVWHLGLVRKLQISFAVRWRRAKVSMMINIPTLNQDPKEKDAEFFSAVLLPPATMPGHNLNETMALFVHLWRPFRPKVGPSAIDPNLPNHAQLRQRRMSKEAYFQRVIFDANERGGKNVAEIKQKIKINVQHSWQQVLIFAIWFYRNDNIFIFNFAFQSVSPRTMHRFYCWLFYVKLFLKYCLIMLLMFPITVTFRIKFVLRAVSEPPWDFCRLAPTDVFIFCCKVETFVNVHLNFSSTIR